MDKRLMMLAIGILIFTGCEVTSADEAAEVQAGLGDQAWAGAEATRGSAQLDLQATATAQAINLQAHATAVYAQVQLTAEAAPAIATASASRRENSTASTNAATSAFTWSVVIGVPLLTLALVLAAYRSVKRVGVVRVQPGEIAVVGQWLIDGATGSARRLTEASGQLPGRVAVQITQAAQPALVEGMGGDWIEGVVGAIKEYEHGQGTDEEATDQRLGGHADRLLQ